MTAPDAFLYEYAVVRYVPRVDREEFINIGLIMLCKRRKWLYGRVLLDKNRLEAFDPLLNYERLSRQALIFEDGNIPFANMLPEEKYRWLTAVKSAVLQTSPSHPGIITEYNKEEADKNLLLDEFNRLFQQLVMT